MAVETNTKNTVTMVLNNGTSATGTVKTVSVSIGTLSTDTTKWSADKALTIARAIRSNCLSKGLYAVQRTASYNLTDE